MTKKATTYNTHQSLDSLLT